MADIPITGDETRSNTAAGSVALSGKHVLVVAGSSSASNMGATLIGFGSDLVIELPMSAISIESLTGTISTFDHTLPDIILELTSLTGTISELSCILPSITISMESPNNATLAISLPMLDFSGYEHGPLTATFNLTLPMLDIILSAIRPAESVACYVLNTETGALSKYTNFSFNSFCEFNGHNLAASPSGIYLLEGENDDGTDIDASFSPGINDFENAQKKRIGNAYILFKGDGQCYLKVTSDDGVQYEYLLESVGERTETVKVKIGKGMKGRSFETEIANIGGTDFEIQEMLLSIETLKRKVG